MQFRETCHICQGCHATRLDPNEQTDRTEICSASGVRQDARTALCQADSQVIIINHYHQNPTATPADEPSASQVGFDGALGPLHR